MNRIQKEGEGELEQKTNNKLGPNFLEIGDSLYIFCSMLLMLSAVLDMLILNWRKLG